MNAQTNIIVIEGRLTSKPLLKRTKSGKSVCRFTISNNRYYFQNKNIIDDVSFFKIAAWGALAERSAETLSKGSLVLVSGTLSSKSIAGSNEQRDDVKITAANIKFLSRRNATSQPCN
ncbi:MAG: single-stranded DNA-binding protein [Spirochaetota bacterium]